MDFKMGIFGQVIMEIFLNKIIADLINLGNFRLKIKQII